MVNENIELYIYDRDLNFKGVIDIYSSLRWRRKYFESGEFELHLQMTEKNKSMFQKDDIIVRENSTEAGFVEGIEIIEDDKKSELVITGRFLSYILHRRIIKNRINFDGPILDGMKTILNNMTPFQILDIENTDLESENIVFQVTYKNVYNHLNKLSLASNIAFRIIPDLENKKLIFQNYVGVNRAGNQKLNPFYEFSKEYSNISKSHYLKHASSLCNYVLVGGEGEGDERILVEIDNTENLHDFDIVEKFVDAKNKSKGDLSSQEYIDILNQKGLENLKEITESIDFDVYIADYKNKWDLGDIVTIKIESWNFNEDLRIIEVEEVIEKNKMTVTPTFGTPLAETYIDEDK